MELSADVAAMGFHAHGDMTNGLTSIGRAGSAAPAVGARLMALERGQKTVAVSAHRALHTAIYVHQQQQGQDHDEEWSKMGAVAKPTPDIEQQCSQRFIEQDERLDRILQLVDTLADKVLLGTLADNSNTSSMPTIRNDVTSLAGRIQDQADASSELRDKVEEMEANLYSLASQLNPQQSGLSYAGGNYVPSDCAASQDNLMVAMENFEARFDRSLSQLSQRVDSMQESRDQHRLTLRQMSQQLPDVAQKLDQLWTQCQHYFPRVKEHDVHFSFFRTSFESHKQQMHELVEMLEQKQNMESSFSTAEYFGAAGATEEDDESESGRVEMSSRAQVLAQAMSRLGTNQDRRAEDAADEESEVARC